MKIARKRYRLVMTGGGSAGHVVPNLALVPKLRDDGWHICYIGSNDRFESALIAQEGVEHMPIVTGKFRRGHVWGNVLEFFKVAFGCAQALILVRKYRPDVVFAKGGYVSFPAGIAAWFHGIPLVIHESDISPGIANRVLIRFAKVICITFQETNIWFRNCKKVRLTGLPVRQKFKQGDAKRGCNRCHFTKESRIILIMGGSRGSTTINDVVEKVLPKLLEAFQVVHLTGAQHLGASSSKNSGYVRLGFTDEVYDLIAMADLVISRGGASTIIELLTMKKLNILIPLPKGTSRGEQIENAIYCKRRGVSYVIAQEELSSNRLLHAISYVFSNKHVYMKALHDFHIEDGTSKICQVLAEIADLS